MQHASSTFTIQIDELLKDLVQYEPRIANITLKDSAEAGDKKIQSFIGKLKQKYKSKMNDEQLALLLINHIQMLRKQKQRIFHIRFEKRQQHIQPEEKSEEQIIFKSQTRILEQQRLKQDLSNDRIERWVIVES